MAISNKVRNNIELLKAMHAVVSFMSHEEAYMWWILLVPDEPSEEDFEFIAEHDDDMDHVCHLFRNIVKAYGKDGWFTAFLAEKREEIVAYGEDKED